MKVEMIFAVEKTAWSGQNEPENFRLDRESNLEVCVASGNRKSQGSISHYEAGSG